MNIAVLTRALPVRTTNIGMRYEVSGLVVEYVDNTIF